MDYFAMDRQYVMQTYRRFPLCIVKGEGSFVWDEQGRRYVDFTAGIGVNSLGYADQQWVQAVCGQAGRLAHISNLYYTEPMLLAAKQLCAKTGMQRVFFANSGAESNEAAIKTARKYANDKYGGERREILCLYHSFHGRTLATLSATGQEEFHQDFHPFLPGFSYTPANDIPSLRENINEKTLAVMIEPVQGEGGVLPLEKIFVRELAAICRERDILLIVDEVQTGVGRSGHFCAFQHYRMEPDILTLAKGLGGGLPIGACLVGEKCADTLGYGKHGSTFGANPVACAGANVVLERLSDDFLNQVQRKGDYMRRRLGRMKGVKSVQGVGMMLGVCIEGMAVKDILAACMERGALFLSAKENLRLLPPLTISPEEMDMGLDILEKILREGA